MTKRRNYARLAVVVALLLATVLVVTKHSRASIGTITKGDLSGSWQMTLFGNTGCGLTSMLVTFTLNGSGTATNASITQHVITTSGCTDGTSTGNTFAINTLTANGSGTAGLSCGAGCGWAFHIQVSPDRSTFNVVDVEPTNPNNLLEGSAIHQ